MSDGLIGPSDAEGPPIEAEVEVRFGPSSPDGTPPVRVFGPDADPFRDDHALFFESFESAVTVEGAVLDMGVLDGGCLRADGTYMAFRVDRDGVRTEWEDPEQGAIMRGIFGFAAEGLPPDPHAPTYEGRDLAAELRDARETYGPGSPEAMLAFERRRAQVEAEEADEPEAWHWLSFAATESDGHNLGVAIVRARGMVGAVKRTHELGINPGGEVQGYEIGDVRDDAWIAAWCDRLISREDALAGIPEPEAWG